MRLKVSVSVLATLTLFLVADRSGKSTTRTRPPELQRLLDTAQRQLASAEYNQARSTYLRALRSTPSLRDFDRASILIGLGNCDLLTQKYGNALALYEAASGIADPAGLVEHQAVIAGNRAAIYRRMADTKSARRAMQSVERVAERSRQPLVLAQLANVMADVEFDRSMSLFATALETARATNQPFAESLVWNQVGMALEDRGRLAEAERAYTEAFRIRALNGRKNLQPSYFYLGRVRSRQGDAGAVWLLERALRLARDPEGQIQLPYIHHELGRAYKSRNETDKALKHFAAAIDSMHEWRLQVLPAETFQISAESFSQKIFSDYISTGMAEFARTGDKSLGARMLAAAESSRNWLFQQRLMRGITLSPTYLEALGKYRRLLARSLDGTDRASALEAEKQRLRVSEMEIRLGIRTEQTNFSHQIYEKVSPDNALIGVQTKLRPTEAFLSFHIGEENSYVWALTSKTFEAHRLAGRAELGSAVREFREAVTSGSGSERRTGEALANLLFRWLGSEVRQKRGWILSLDGALFEAPLAAVPEGDGWLIGYHTLRRASSAMLGGSDAGPGSPRAFIAIADPVFNRADPRLRGGGAKSRETTELARLPGTVLEARACAKAWGRDPDPEVVTDTDVGRDRLMAAAASQPAVLHIATHFVPHPAFPDQILIALGTRKTSGEQEYLAPADIAFRRMKVGLVTLSGCGSGGGAALPGLGVFGLTRAWLMAGAAAVVATQWPITDDSGGILAAMYGRLARTTGGLSAAKAAEALREAQLRMIQAGGWRSKPVYWAAFEVMGKE